jgi:MFS family permease
VAGAQMVAGVTAPRVRKLFGRRTHVLLFMTAVGAVCLWLIGSTARLGVVIALVAVWGLAFAVTMPVRQAFLNGSIPSERRATVLSFDNLMQSAGGVVTQPALGRVADVWGYASAYLVCALVQLTAIPFLLLARRTNAPSDAGDQAPSP